MTFGSLFAGIGGMDLGLKRAGMTCKWQVEIDPYARRVLERHWPDVRRWDDVRTFPPDVADAEGERREEGRSVRREQRQKRLASCRSPWHVDLICGGFPCQDISFAGKGAGLAGERSGLWYEFARVVGVLAPRYVLIENVAALLVRGLDQVLGSLASLGYDAEWTCLPAAAVGAPHRRDRVFIVAHAQRSGWATSGTCADQAGPASTVVGSSHSWSNRSGHQSQRRDAVAHAAGDGRQQRRAEPAGLVGEPALACGRGEVSDADGDDGRTRHQSAGREAGADAERRGGGAAVDIRDADLPRLAQRLCFGGDARAELAAFERANRQAGGQWGSDPADDPESGVGRVADGVPNRIHRLRGLGNAVVPQVAEFIGRMILQHAEASS